MPTEKNVNKMFENIVSRTKKTHKITDLPTANVWNHDDKKFFEDNPELNYRARKVFKGELEETYDVYCECIKIWGACSN